VKFSKLKNSQRTLTNVHFDKTDARWFERISAHADVAGPAHVIEGDTIVIKLPVGGSDGQIKKPRHVPLPSAVTS
jgi:hypothetical protein